MLMGTEVDTVSLDNSVDPIAHCSVQCAAHTQPCTTVQCALQYSSVQCAVQCSTVHCVVQCIVLYSVQQAIGTHFIPKSNLSCQESYFTEKREKNATNWSIFFRYLIACR